MRSRRASLVAMAGYRSNEVKPSRSRIVDANTNCSTLSDVGSYDFVRILPVPLLWLSLILR